MKPKHEYHVQTEWNKQVIYRKEFPDLRSAQSHARNLREFESKRPFPHATIRVLKTTTTTKEVWKEKET